MTPFRALTRPSRTWRGLMIAAPILVWLALIGVAQAAPTFPALSGRVVDEAHILSPQTQSELTSKLEAVESSTGRQVVVATIADLQGYPIEDYGYQLGRAWQVGDAKKDDGVVFLIAPNDRKVRIEVGYGLEPILTDALSSTILQRAVLPRFKTGDIQGGVVAGTDEILKQLALPEGEARAIAQAATTPAHQQGQNVPGFVVFIIFILIWMMMSRRRRSGGLASALPWIVLDGLTRRGGGWGGDDHWGGGGGGGFSGGGGSFGGGGSSGSW
jgi:uncharacterized protein